VRKKRDFSRWRVLWDEWSRIKTFPSQGWNRKLKVPAVGKEGRESADSPDM